ncbi:methyltransferase family protein [Vannielia litorea]|uniref:Protein-S-isoprenylcysteine O-methyltransferase Ste14 n=1 Tax=Vannielia litorea TaxID=1217970 RepID=A0A1N6ETQ4_9RHOB|nr:isoprenylcysteine carboxylmethyltransferase family protein [Vannielia litorea]SIN86406.1 Protein-S-isoprenylcysteine O-methyltransferase Ste14 [Vannielia litorea]
MQGPGGNTGFRAALSWLDMPPLWLLLFIALARVQAVRFPELAWKHPASDLAGGLLVGAGLLLFALAVMEFSRARTTIVPHREARSLITTGIYTRSRNPIYLGDLLILAGLCAFWGVWLALAVLVPLFAWLVTDRFIRPEEARLAARFGPEWEAWAARVRRWV